MSWLADPFNILFGLLAAALLLALLRLLRGPSLADRVVALDVITVQVIGLIGAFVVAMEQALFLDAAIVLAIISFVGTIAFARYLERRGQDE